MTIHFGGSETEGKLLTRHKRYNEIAQERKGRMFKILLFLSLEVVGSVGYWVQSWQGFAVSLVSLLSVNVILAMFITEVYGQDNENSQKSRFRC